MIFRIALALSVVAASPALAQAQTRDTLSDRNPTASNFVETCKDIDTPSLKNIHCMGYVAGVIGGIGVGAIAMGYAVAAVAPNVKINKMPIPCVPDRATMTEIIKITLKYLDAHPEMLHNNAASVIDLALMDVWGLDGPGCR